MQMTQKLELADKDLKNYSYNHDKKVDTYMVEDKGNFWRVYIYIDIQIDR